MADIHDLTKASDVAKEIRARVADLNELVMTASKRGIRTEMTVVTPELDEETDGLDYETLHVRVSQTI